MSKLWIALLLAGAVAAGFFWPAVLAWIRPNRDAQAFVVATQEAARRGDFDTWLAAVDPSDRPALTDAVTAAKRFAVLRDRLSRQAEDRFGASARDAVLRVPGEGGDPIGVLAAAQGAREIVEPQIRPGASPEWREAVLLDRAGGETRVPLHAIGGRWYLCALGPNAPAEDRRQFQEDAAALSVWLDSLANRMERLEASVANGAVTSDEFLSELRDLQTTASLESLAPAEVRSP